MKSRIAHSPSGLLQLISLAMLLQFTSVTAGELTLDTGNEYSIALPTGWAIEKIKDKWSDTKRRVAVGPAIDVPASDKLVRSDYDEQHPAIDPYRPHLSVRSIPWSDWFPRKDYFGHYLQSAALPGSQLRMVKRSKFVTQSGQTGDVVVFEWEGERARLRQTVFLFPSAEKLFVIECDILARNGEKLDSTFEGIAKTFKLTSAH